MASDEKILDELHFLSWKIEALERKLETSLAIQEDLAAGLLLEDSSSTASAMAIKKFSRRNVSGSSCSELISSDEEHNSRRSEGTSSKELEHEQERSTSYLIIPVGSYKDKDSNSFPAEKQTFTWSELDDKACKYISSEGVQNGDKEIENNLDANERDSNKPNISNTPGSFADQATPLSQRRFVTSERQMCTQRNGNASEIMPLEDCLPNSRGTHSTACESFDVQQKIGGAFDIEYHEDEKIVPAETKSTTPSSNGKYGLTIGIATAMGSSQGIGLNYLNSLRKVDLRGDQYREHSERVETHFETEGSEEQRAVALQLKPLLTKSTAQSAHSSVEVTFDQICNHSSESMSCDNGFTEYKHSSSDFAYDKNTYSAEKHNQPAYNVIYVNSESSEDDKTNYDFVDAYVQDPVSYERNSGSLNANLGVQSSLANTAPDSKQVLVDYPLLANNEKYENDVYSTQKIEPYQNGNDRFKQNEVDCDASSKRLIEMQIHGVPGEQRYCEDSYYTHKRFDAENILAHNREDGDLEMGRRSHDIARNVNNSSASSITDPYRVNGTKPRFQEVDEHISQFGDRVYGIVGYNNDYKAINTDNSDKAGERKAGSRGTPVHPCYEKNAPNHGMPACGPHTNFREDRNQTSHRQSQKHLQQNERALCNDTQSKFRIDADNLTESGFSETLMSPISDEVFFAATPNPNAEHKMPSNTAILADHTAASESESPYSSLTSVSSNNEVIYPWNLRKDSLSRHHEYEKKKQSGISNSGDSPVERNLWPYSAPSYVRDNESSSDSEPPMRSFRLSPLPRPARAPSLHEQLLRDVIPRDYTTATMRVSSPTSSVDTSDLSMSDSICECQYQCECQTGIPSVEDFREELKAISTFVLNARKESSSYYKKPRTRYFLDEEEGDMTMFEKKENKAVPILVRVILRLRKHFFGTIESKTANIAKSYGDVNNNESDLNQTERQTLNGKHRIRKISFSPSAMLMSAIGENSAAEVKEVIEKEKIDVNQISPSGRSLLHKAAAAGDLESIHTLIQYGAVVDIPDQDGFPPIHSALRKAHFKCAILLIECGADVARYTSERVREFYEIKYMAAGHMPVLLKTNL